MQITVYLNLRQIKIYGHMNISKNFPRKKKKALHQFIRYNHGQLSHINQATISIKGLHQDERVDSPSNASSGRASYQLSRGSFPIKFSISIKSIVKLSSFIVLLTCIIYIDHLIAISQSRIGPRRYAIFSKFFRLHILRYFFKYLTQSFMINIRQKQIFILNILLNKILGS